MSEKNNVQIEIEKLQTIVDSRVVKITDVRGRIARQEEHVQKTLRKKESFEEHLARWLRQNERDIKRINALKIEAESPLVG